jgi:hypothetical protein
MQNWTPETEAQAAKAPEDAFVAWLRAEPSVQAWMGLIFVARTIIA